MFTNFAFRPSFAWLRVYSVKLTSSCATIFFMIESPWRSLYCKSSEHSLIHHIITLAKTSVFHSVTIATDDTLLLELHACMVMIYRYYVFVEACMMLRIGKWDIGDIFCVEISSNGTNLREAAHHFPPIGWGHSLVIGWSKYRLRES